MSKKWICTVCGYVHEGDTPPAQCPVCRAKAEKFVEIKDEGLNWACEHKLGDGQVEDAEVLQEAVALAGGELVDTPPDMSVVLNRGRYYVCPTCKGGGVKLRVMDGLRAGLPVLCHEVSARGYEPFFDVTLFRYGDPGSFRTALDRMLSATPDVESALSCYRNAFSFEAGTKRLEELMKCLWTVRTF